MFLCLHETRDERANHTRCVGPRRRKRPRAERGTGADGLLRDAEARAGTQTESRTYWETYVLFDGVLTGWFRLETQRLPVSHSVNS